MRATEAVRMVSISAERQLRVSSNGEEYEQNINENIRHDGVNIANKQPKRLLGLAQSRHCQDEPLVLCLFLD